MSKHLINTLRHIENDRSIEIIKDSMRKHLSNNVDNLQLKYNSLYLEEVEIQSVRFNEEKQENETYSTTTAMLVDNAPTFEEYQELYLGEIESKIDEELKKIPEFNQWQLMDRERQLDKLVITIENGKQFNGDRKSISLLESAIKTAELYHKRTGETLDTTTWRLYNNKNVVVTIEELEEAFIIGNMQQSNKFIELSEGI